MKQELGLCNRLFYVSCSLLERDTGDPLREACSHGEVVIAGKLFFISFFFFWMGTSFEAFIELVTVLLLLFYVGP